VSADVTPPRVWWSREYGRLYALPGSPPLVEEPETRFMPSDAVELRAAPKGREDMCSQMGCGLDRGTVVDELSRLLRDMAHRATLLRNESRANAAAARQAREDVSGFRLTVAAQARQLGVLETVRLSSDRVVEDLRRQVAATEARLNSALTAGEVAPVGYLRDTLALIAEYGCSVSSRGTPCYEPNSGRDRVSTTGTADQWCDSCRAADALAQSPVPVAAALSGEAETDAR
jgi:hypothetical protein